MQGSPAAAAVRLVALILGAVLVAGARFLAGAALPPVAASAPANLQFLPAPPPVAEAALPRGDLARALPLIPAEPPWPAPFRAPRTARDRDGFKTLRAWGLNPDLMYATEHAGRAAPREAVRAVATLLARRPGQFPLGEPDLPVPADLLHYFPPRPEAELSLLLLVRAPLGGVYLLERSGSSWRVVPLLEEESPGVAKAAEVRDLNGDGLPEICLIIRAGAGLTVALYGNPAAPGGPRMLWRSPPLPGGGARFVDLDGDGRPELQLDADAADTTLAGGAGMPRLRERYTLTWRDGAFRLAAHARQASRAYWLRLFLHAAAQGNWDLAASAWEPAAVKSNGPPERWLPAALRKVQLPGGWLDELGPATVVHLPGAGYYVVEYGPTGRINRLQPLER